MAPASLWSSSYRGRAAYVSGSDSGSGSDIDADTNDARLLREMDLSGRHETVEYRPNPWSIARINAASRPKPTLARARSPPKPQPKPIVEAFKKQDDSIGAKRGANKSRQGCATEPGSTIHAVEALEQRKSAHIPTVSDHVPPPFRPRQTFVTHRVADRPTFHHSSPPRSHVPVSAHTMRPLPPPLVSASAYADTNDLPCVSPGRSTGQETAPSWLLDALDEAIPPPPLPLVPGPRQDATDPPHIRTPEPKRKRLPTPPPRPSATRPLDPDAAPSRRCTTAYAFGEDDDPDAEWSTLARAKRKAPSAKRVAKPSGVRQSGRFHLPLLGLAQGTPTRARAPEVKRRVITYLPPPMASKKLVDDVDGGPRASTNYQVQADEANMIAMTKHAEVEAEAHEEEEEMPVMDSDVTLVNEDEEGVAQIDVDDVCARYPATRACMKAESRVRRMVGCVVELRM